MPSAGRHLPPLDQAALQTLEVAPASLTVYRTGYLPPRSVPDPFYTQPSTNRFGTPAGTIYTASSATIAWAETCRNVWAEIEDSNPLGVTNASLAEIAAFGATRINRLVPARAVFELELELKRVVDLRAADAQEALERAGVPPADLHADDYGRCSDLAQAAVSLGWEAIIVPSAAWDATDGFCLPVFKPTAAGVATRVDLIEAAALPTVAVAHLTHYPDGCRPSWLP